MGKHRLCSLTWTVTRKRDQRGRRALMAYGFPRLRCCAVHLSNAPPEPSSTPAEDVRGILWYPVLPTDIQEDPRGLGVPSEPKLARTFHRLPPIGEGIVVNIHDGGQTGNLAISISLF